MPANWGLAYGPNGFQNAFATGVQFGQQARAAQDQREYKNALANYDPSKPETVKAVMAVDPRTGLALQKEATAQQAAAREAEIKRAAAEGDPQAMAQLAGIDLNAWRGLSGDQKQAAAETTKVFGNAALDVLSRPPEQRAAAWDAYVAQLAQQYPEVAKYQGQYSEQAARSVVAQAEMIDKLHQQERPSYMAVPFDSTLVNTKDPAAVAAFGAGADIPTLQSPEQARGLPPGSTFRTPDGRVMRVPGGGVSNGTGGF